MERNMDDVISEAPSAVVVNAAKDREIVTDERGRTIIVQKLTLLDFYLLTKAMGEDSSNQTLMDMAITASAVRRIDTTDFAKPHSETDVRFLMQLLDFDGLKAAGEGLKKVQAKVKKDSDAAKNLAGSQPSS
jgi:hypothetical protein